jgi:hypothetical protein
VTVNPLFIHGRNRVRATRPSPRREYGLRVTRADDASRQTDQRTPRPALGRAALEKRQRELTRVQAELDQARRLLNAQTLELRSVAAVASRTAVLEGEQERTRIDLELANQVALRAERRLWDSINTIHDGFAVFNARHELVVANQSFLRVFAGLPEVQPGITYGRLAEILVQEGRVLLGEGTGQDWVAMMLARWQQDEIPPQEIALADGGMVRLMDRRARGGDIVTLARNITESVRHAGRAGGGALARRGREPGQIGLSGEYEPRDPHPDERRRRHGRAAVRHPLTEEQKLCAETIRSFGRGAAAHHQRCARLLEDRGRQADAAGPSPSIWSAASMR